MEPWNGTIEDKDRFHREARRLLHAVAREIGLARGGYDVRSNRAGVCVSGEVTLHADSLYLSVAGDHVFARSCHGRDDYTGGPNHPVEFELLYDIPSLVSVLRLYGLLDCEVYAS